jgi:hypothetical protein
MRRRSQRAMLEGVPFSGASFTGAPKKKVHPGIPGNAARILRKK